MENIYFLKPIAVRKKWGNNDFKGYGYIDDTFNDIGELILLTSSYFNPSLIVNLMNGNMDFLHYYSDNKDLFKTKTGIIPVEIKIINPAYLAKVNFSPNNFIAKKTYKKFGQKKYWISLPGYYENKVIVGDVCQSISDIDQMLLNKQITTFGNIISLDFLNGIKVDSHQVNAILSQAIIFEISFSDFFEYDLSDVQNFDTKQYMYITKAIQQSKRRQKITVDKINNETEFLVNDGFFKVQIITVDNIMKIFNFKDCNFAHLFVVSGEGKVNNYNISTGSNFVAVGNKDIIIEGNLKIIVTYVKDLLV